jgi:dihydroorotate dehydrogenase (NAD+) catalytic subunit
MLNTEVQIGSLKLKNPVMTASGTFGFGREYGEYYDLSQLGAVVVKGLTLKPREGNASPRIAETPAGILNSVGLQNPGVEAFLAEELPYLRQYDTAVIANIAGNTVEEYCRMAEILGSQVDAVELNISCPNVKEGGVAFGTKCASVHQITKAVKEYCKVPLIVKLSPNVTDIVEIALAAQEAGADGLSLINTLLGMAIDIHSKKPVLANVVGGLSGPAVKPVAVRMVYQVSQAVSIPVIGMGGICSWQDAVEFLLAGSDAVAIGTYHFVNPYGGKEIKEGIEGYMRQNNIEKIGDIKSKLLKV